MLNKDILKNLIASKNYNDAKIYIVNEFEELLKSHFSEYTDYGSIDISEQNPELTGIMMNYTCILNDETTDEICIARLMSCYDMLEKTLGNS